MLAGNLDSRAVKYMQARVSRYEHTGYYIAGSSRHAYHFKNPTFSWKVQVTLPLFFCHVLKRPKDIESDMFSGGLVYLFHAREIKMTHCNGEGQ